MTKFPPQSQLDAMRRKLNKGLASRPLARDAGPVDKVKFKICEHFVIYLNVHKMTQKALAKKLNIDEALMSKILHYHFDEFTVDRLLKYLNVLYPNVEIDLKVA